MSCFCLKDILSYRKEGRIPVTLISHIQFASGYDIVVWKSFLLDHSSSSCTRPNWLTVVEKVLSRKTSTKYCCCCCKVSCVTVGLFCQERTLQKSCRGKKSKGILSERFSLLSPLGSSSSLKLFKNRPFSQYYHCCLSWKLEKTFESEYDFFPRVYLSVAFLNCSGPKLYLILTLYPLF